MIHIFVDMLVFFFFFKQKTAYEMLRSLVGSEMCIRDRYQRRVRGTLQVDMVSTAVTYLCWLVGPWCGLHHLYLGRNLQAYLTASLSPTVLPFILAWFRDMVRIPSYVAEANQHPDVIEVLKMKQRQTVAPSLGWTRVIAMLFFGQYSGIIFCTALSVWSWADRSFPILEGLLRALGVAVGVWAVGNVGHMQLGAAEAREVWRESEAKHQGCLDAGSGGAYAFSCCHQWSPRRAD
eukprot:TRINITY_DN12466_c0_g1_i3.p1 TRINITY_DN12466_c0_g1~~TRINITY_DN12466_c0_g1_i3.p1  ORF type:complete len:235 (-),score=59.96 TRINITY_DN12466_c0_g1_i3:565-1269(-)